MESMIAYFFSDKLDKGYFLFKLKNILTKLCDIFCLIIGLSGLIFCLFSTNLGQIKQQTKFKACFVEDKEWDCAKKKQFVLCDSKGKPYRLNSEQIMKNVIRKTDLMRPAGLGRNNLFGTVIIEVVIDKFGKVICAKGINGNMFAKGSARISLRSWRFNPFRLKGKTVSVIGVLNIDYDFR